MKSWPKLIPPPLARSSSELLSSRPIDRLSDLKCLQGQPYCIVPTSTVRLVTLARSRRGSPAQWLNIIEALEALQ